MYAIWTVRNQPRPDEKIITDLCDKAQLLDTRCFFATVGEICCEIDQAQHYNLVSEELSKLNENSTRLLTTDDMYSIYRNFGQSNQFGFNQLKALRKQFSIVLAFDKISKDPNSKERVAEIANNEFLRLMQEDSGTLIGIQNQIEGVSGVVYTEQIKSESLAQSLVFGICDNKEVF